MSLTTRRDRRKIIEKTLILPSSLHDFKEIIKIYCNSQVNWKTRFFKHRNFSL